MANNVLFKRGLSGALPWDTADEGAFYLTTDTNRLYVGQSEGKLAEINRYVKVIDNMSQLPTNPHQDDFVYISNDNILAVCTNPDASTVAGKWTQINPDTNTNTNTYLTRADATAELKPVSASPDNDEQKIVVTLDLYNSIKDELLPEADAKEITTPVKVSFDITQDMISTVNETNVGLTVKESTGGAGISLSGPGADSQNLSINLVQGSNVTITGAANDDKITISATDTTYDLTTVNESGSAYLVLKGSDNSEDKIKIQTGNDAIAATVGTGYIDYTHKDYTTTPVEKKDVQNGAKESITLSHSGSFTAITGLTADKGHVTGYTVQTYNLPEDENTTYTVNEVSADDQGQITVKLKGSDSDTLISKTSGKDLYYTVNGVPVYNKGTIDFYTKAELDQKFYAVDAMTYKGTIGGSNNLPTNNVHNGDTYKVAIAGTYGGYACTVGDLLIATGEELATKVDLETGEKLEAGTISPDKLEWTYVPSGDDTDTHYDLTLQNNTISLSNDVDSEIDNVLFAAGEDLVVTTTSTTTGTTTTPTLSYSHKTYSDLTATPGEKASNLVHGGSFTVIDGITASNGHITGYSTKTFNLPTDEDTTYTLDGEVAAATDTKGVVVTDKLTKTGTTTYTSSVIGYSSDTLKITTGTKASNEDARVTINLEWGSF